MADLSPVAGNANYTFTWPTGNGYTCTCGVYVPFGTAHSCWNWNWPQPVYYPTYYSAQPVVTRFRGSVKKMKDLPAPRLARVGDAYHVEDPGVLVVRVANGWHQFDGNPS